jgi:hypothetical protein
MGNDLKLETRYCKCGCGKSWRCLPTSDSVYALTWHKGINAKQTPDGWNRPASVEAEAIKAKIRQRVAVWDNTQGDMWYSKKKE